MDDTTLEWMVKLPTQDLVDVVFHSGRINHDEKDYWVKMFEAMRASVPLPMRCDEQLPQVGEPVLMWHNWLKHWVNGKLEDMSQDPPLFRFMDGAAFYPTHWMRLPAKPLLGDGESQ